MLYIAGGEFEMGASEDRGQDDERPLHRVRLGAFCIDRTEVSVEAYATCAQCSPPRLGAGCNGGFPARGRHPVNCVRWADAAQYCLARGARLPSEAQWEYAARGADSRTAPWGAGMPWERLCWERSPEEGTCTVGSFPRGATPQGVLDLEGNVAEWVGDWYAPYGTADAQDPRGPLDGTARVFRGTSWESRDPIATRSSRRDSASPSRAFATVGFRCVAAPR